MNDADKQDIDTIRQSHVRRTSKSNLHKKWASTKRGSPFFVQNGLEKNEEEHFGRKMRLRETGKSI